MAMTATFRLAEPKDTPLILEFIRALAAYEKLAHEVVADEATLARHLFGDRSSAQCLIAEVHGSPAGFAIFFHNFSTFLGRPGLYIEDIFVKPEFRAMGLGRSFFRELARLAQKRDCGRMEWWVLDWNEPAIAFYKKMGARPMDEWTVQRLTRAEIDALAA